MRCKPREGSSPSSSTRLSLLHGALMRGTWLLVTVLLAVTPARGSTGDPPTPQWPVAPAPASREAGEPLRAHRKAQGLRVEVVQTTDVLSPEEIAAGDARKLRARIHELCRAAGGPSYVLLVGAVG